MGNTRQTQTDEGATIQEETPQEETQKPESGIELKFKNEAERQAWIDRQIGPRLKREREAAEEDEREKQRKKREKLEEDAARQSAELEGKWENYAETLRTKLEDANTRIAELEGKAGEVESTSGSLQEHAEVLEELLSSDLERIPEHYRAMPGFEESSMVQKAKWIAVNREKLEPVAEKSDDELQAERDQRERELRERNPGGGVPPVHRAGRSRGDNGVADRREAEESDAQAQAEFRQRRRASV